MLSDHEVYDLWVGQRVVPGQPHHALGVKLIYYADVAGENIIERPAPHRHSRLFRALNQRIIACVG